MGEPKRQRNESTGLTGQALLDHLLERRRLAAAELDINDSRIAALDRAIGAARPGRPIPATSGERAPIEDPAP